MKTRKLFVKYCGKWYEVNHIKGGKLYYSKIEIIISRYDNGKPLSKLTIPLNYCSNIKIKKVKVKKNE